MDDAGYTCVSIGSSAQTRGRRGLQPQNRFGAPQVQVNQSLGFLLLLGSVFHGGFWFIPSPSLETAFRLCLFFFLRKTDHAKVGQVTRQKHRGTETRLQREGRNFKAQGRPVRQPASQRSSTLICFAGRSMPAEGSTNSSSSSSSSYLQPGHHRGFVGTHLSKQA